ncbi:MAG: glutaredoxin 3 [Bauldia sp.]|nr:glutaredoxin 3 [Bauldia sp.]MCW5719448.1 glutaredoxin 3 [Bauldia sp.]
MNVIEIYARPACGYCELAKELLRRRRMAYSEYDVTADRSRMSEMLDRSGGHMSLPQIFIGGRHVGGYMELAELDRRGALNALVAA